MGVGQVWWGQHWRVSPKPTDWAHLARAHWLVPNDSDPREEERNRERGRADIFCNLQRWREVPGMEGQGEQRESLIGEGIPDARDTLQDSIYIWKHSEGNRSNQGI